MNEKEIDKYIDDMYDKNIKYVDKELEYADKMHNLEKEVGCPLEVVLKALLHGFYFKNKYEKLQNIKHYFKALLDLRYKRILIQEYVDTVASAWYVDYMYINLSDYKKTWWLKEDKSE